VTLVARIGALSDIGLHRKTNEDSFVTAAPLFAVCDGMGGALAGEVASALAAETLAAGVARGDSLLDSAEAANAAVFAKAANDSGHQGMGTTLTAVRLEGETGHFVHIGDSRGYLLRAGELRQVTDDHSLVGEMMREGRLTEDEAAVHPHRSVLSRALGTEAQVHIDEFELDLEDGDVLLLCSDGLSGPVPAADIRRALGRDDPRDAARRLIAEARKHGGPDNITAVVLRLDDAPAAGDEAPADEAATAILDAGAAETAVLPAVEPATAVLPAPRPESEADGALQRPPVESEADGASSPPVAGDASAETHDAGDAAAEAVGVTTLDASAPDDASVPDGRRRSRRLGLVVVILSLVLLVGLAAAFTTSAVFFVGVAGGRLVVYSGVPVRIGDHRLNPVYRKSTRSYDALSPQQKALVDAQTIHDRDGVMTLAASLGMWP
jgi:PPM family protein phosphatase